MNNSVDGKTIESKRCRLKVEITRNAERTEKIVSKFEFERFEVFGENMAAMCSKPKNKKTGTHQQLLVQASSTLQNFTCTDSTIMLRGPVFPFDCSTQIRTFCFVRWRQTIYITNWKSKPRM